MVCPDGLGYAGCWWIKILVGDTFHCGGVGVYITVVDEGLIVLDVTK